MTTVAVMATRMSGHINRGSTYDTQIREAINTAVKHYKPRRFTFNTKRSTASTVKDQEYYALPNDLKEIDMLRVLYSSGDYTDPLHEVTYRWIERHRHNVSYVSQPEKFAVQGLDLRLWPVPDAAYTLTMTYLRDIGGFSATATDATTNEWTTDAEELIRSRAMVDVLLNTVGGKDSKTTAAGWFGREKDAYKTLRRQANRRESAGRIMPYL